MLMLYNSIIRKINILKGTRKVLCVKSITQRIQNTKEVCPRWSPPWIPDPTFFHREEDASSVGRYFAQSLINKEPKLKDLLFIGLDRIKRSVIEGLVIYVCAHCKKKY